MAITSPSDTVENLQGQFAKQSPLQYQKIAASQTAKALGAVGGKAGDYLSHLVVSVDTAASASFSILDGGTTIYSAAASPGSGIGNYIIPVGCSSVEGAWKITNGAGVTILAVGQFS